MRAQGKAPRMGRVSAQKRAEAFEPREQHEQGKGVRSSSPPGHARPWAGSDLYPAPERPRNWGLPALRGRGALKTREADDSPGSP